VRFLQIIFTQRLALAPPETARKIMKTPQDPEAAETVQTTEIPAVAPAATCSRLVARMADCMKIQNAKNEGSAECGEWIAMDREFALKTALNQVTAGIGIMVLAGCDPEELLTRWAEAVERRNPDTSNA
jgi:hypothetical protein